MYYDLNILEGTDIPVYTKFLFKYPAELTWYHAIVLFLNDSV